jgi:hypothetical protein
VPEFAPIETNVSNLHQLPQAFEAFVIIRVIGVLLKSHVIRVEPSRNSCLRSDHRDEMAQLVFDVAGRRNCVRDFLSQ